MRMQGERFIFGFEAGSVTAPVEKMIAEWRISGVVLFSRNVKSARQLASLCRELQAIQKRVSPLPLIIAVDQEGGSVNRIADGATHFPSPMAVAAAGDVDLAGRIGYAMGCQLMRLGVNMNFAPVLDINTRKNNPAIGVRSFGENPEQVAAFGAAMIRGMERAGVASVAKHFPGIGSAEQDPHAETPVITRSAEELEREDLIPFARAVDAGVSGIMIGHARYPALSADPASLSGAVVRGLLRGELRFRGLAITDDLEMGAVGASRSAGDAAVKACGAGADLLLVCHSGDAQAAAMAALAGALNSGKLRPENITGSVERLRAFKERLLARLTAAHDGAPENGEDLAREAAERAITLVSDGEKVLPLRMGPGEKLLVLSPVLGPLTAAEDGAAAEGTLAGFIGARHPMTETVPFEIVPSRGNFDRIREALRGARAVVMGTCNAHLYGEQARLVREVAAAGKPTVFVALRNPYDAELYPPRAARLAAYGSDGHTLCALARVMFGELPTRGRLPVTLDL
ncbi:MAG: beta-N-acetylhexosaminidase [Candidatus Aureabacteria bacterium]|nr:beta-N-acetylhexosaminidase [Candidatus Auribacterota bacterium]